MSLLMQDTMLLKSNTVVLQIGTKINYLSLFSCSPIEVTDPKPERIYKGRKALMQAYLLKEIEFEDLVGNIIVLPKGLIVKIARDDKLLLIEKDHFEYMISVTKRDYRHFCEMN